VLVAAGSAQGSAAAGSGSGMLQSSKERASQEEIDLMRVFWTRRVDAGASGGEI